jgi:hypothetical protein
MHACLPVSSLPGSHTPWHEVLRLLFPQGLSRQGLHATAFEVAKLLLLLDPDDPMGVFFCIDYFAMRAHDHAWLIVRKTPARRLHACAACVQC